MDLDFLMDFLKLLSKLSEQKKKKKNNRKKFLSELTISNRALYIQILEKYFEFYNLGDSKQLQLNDLCQRKMLN